TGYEEGFGIHVDPDGNLLVTGSFPATVDFDPGPGSASLTSAGDADSFVLQLSGEGDYLHAVSFGGTNYDRGYSITRSGSGAIYLTGWFTGTTDLDPGAGSQSATSQGSNDIYLVKLVEANTTGISELQTGSGMGIELFPNPAKDRLNIVVDPSLIGQRAVIEVFNTSGTRVHAEQVNAFGALQTLDLSGEWPEGLYLVMVRVEGQAPKAARVVVRR
ncbi:MAG: T9SS type A sorting domain-containing protein, partial [Bacteroidetes bacterium]|nr:T9SS type A sorting domain-containing protein [Bacteroidota bacterium]